MNNEIVWAGLLIEPANAKQTAHMLFVELAPLEARLTDALGDRNVAHYDIQGEDFVTISIDGSLIGLGIACADEAEAARKLIAAQGVLSHLKLQGSLSVWKMYNCPKAA